MKELCWLMTTKCNQSCGYCDRFLKEDELNDEEYQRILKKLIEYEVKQITFGGGEALILVYFLNQEQVTHQHVCVLQHY